MYFHIKQVALWPLLALLPAVWASAQTNVPGFSPAAADTVVELGKPYRLALSVQAEIAARSAHRNTLNGFELRVTATALDAGSATSEPLAGEAAVPLKRWFRRLGDSKPGYRLFNLQKNKLEDSELEWLDKKGAILLNGEPIASVQSDRNFAELLIQSEARMNEHDVLRLGEFVYQPDQPGAHRLNLELSYQGVITESDSIDVYFECPAHEVTLKAPSNKLLYRIEYSTIDVPPMSNTFFAEKSVDYSAQATDAMFRSLFMHTTVNRLNCDNYEIRLLPLYDRIAGETSKLGMDRAIKLKAEYDALLSKTTRGNACESRVRIDSLKGATAVWKRYIKGPSEISQDLFAQENRVIPVEMDLATQRVVLAPLRVKTEELSDELSIGVESLPIEFCESGVESGYFTLRNEQGDTLQEAPPHPVLLDVLQGKYSFAFRSAQQRGFLLPGKYSAELHLQLRWPQRHLRSKPVEFIIYPFNLIRDEIFALNLYDRPEFTHRLDSIRVDSLAARVLHAANDTLKRYQQSILPNSLILISGHACILGERLYKQYYNLGLSFSRALFLKELLLKSLRQQVSKYGLTLEVRGELCDAKRTVARFIDEPNTAELLKSCFAASNGRSLEPIYASLMDRMIEDKVRHFKSRPVSQPEWESRVPEPETVRQQIAALRPDLPANLTHVTLSKGTQTIQLYILSAGFGIAVPFYRHCELPESTKQSFRADGYSENQIPASFFGDDNTAAGRHLNRRVEVSIVWQY